MPNTDKSKRYEAGCFKRSLNVAEVCYLSMDRYYTSPGMISQVITLIFGHEVRHFTRIVKKD